MKKFLKEDRRRKTGKNFENSIGKIKYICLKISALKGRNIRRRENNLSLSVLLFLGFIGSEDKPMA
ncbi:hypothetical protein [Cognataquiflexum aquatile]|uniref:hypothetical protein n=1 Tax=Cognataquiflexum aquatile TaxID=2249427 RepID=UPI0013004D8A|nr:hypothetical protein [Cognataquiflexum aquatile]